MKRQVGVPSYTYTEKEAWFRSPDWDEDAKSEWDRRIARAHLQNGFQYRRIKGLALLESGDPARERVGEEMLEYVIGSEEAYAFERVTCLSELARHELARGRTDAAEKHLRDCLARVQASGNSSGTNGEESIALAEILIEKGTPPALLEACHLVAPLANDPPVFATSRFRLAVAYARLELLAGDKQAAQQWAAAALKLASATDSGFRYHPDIGLVRGQESTIDWLQKVAARN